MKCSQCGGSRFDEDPARGDMVCAECGAVESENAVASSVEYVDNPNGTATALGNFVSSESQMPGFRESRHVTEQKARKRIETICGQLRLGTDVAVSAFRYYQSALFRGFTRGRSSLQLAAACIYIAARQLRVNLMLLDLSDAVAINVYQVGRTYSDLKRRLNLSLPEVDPCLFVERFACQLDFGDKTTTVATTAMQLLQRMKKDWICTGRRPSGLAAASLLVAARIHEFNRTEEDVAKVARISQMTTRRRLMEFSRTPSSALSIDAFFTVDYDEEQDPPCFGQQTQRRRFDLKDLDMDQVSAEIKELGRRIDAELGELANKRKLDVALSDPDLAKSKGLRHLIQLDDHTAMQTLKSGEDGEMEEETFVGKGRSEKSVIKGDSPSPRSPSAKPTGSSRQVLRDVLDGVVDPEILDYCVEDLELLTAHSGNELCELVDATQQWRNSRNTAEATETTADIDGKQTIASPLASSLPTHTPTDESFKLPCFFTPRESALSTNEADDKAVEGVEANVRYGIDLTGIDDEELDREYFLTPQETMVKAALWFREFGPFLEEQRQKKAEKRRLKEEKAKQPKKPRRGPRKIYKRQRRMPWHVSNKEDVSDGDLNEDEDSQQGPISKKINYAALEAIVGSKAGTSSVDGDNNISVAAAGSSSPSNYSVPEEGTEDGRSATSSIALHVTNRLLEKTVRAATKIPKSLLAPVAPPVSVQNHPEQEEQEEEEEDEALEPEGMEENLYDEEEEEVDWREGDELW